MFGKFCSPETLKTYDFSTKSLIFSDCEGYEDVLFDKLNLTNLINCDIIIECHDVIKEGITDRMISLFKDTHDIEVIESKLKSISDYESLKSLNFRYYTDSILIERNTRMNWLIIKSRL